MPTKDVDRCEVCRFWLCTQPPSGLCRRYPPRPEFTLAEQRPLLGVTWPGMGPNDWCGECDPVRRSSRPARGR